jgi:macrolide transport system ATP-binding/permease protein
MEIIGQHVLRGRGITAQDTPTSPGVAVVNREFVRKFLADAPDPIGVHFGLDNMKSASDIEIVGVVADAKYQNPKRPQRAMYFRPLMQFIKNSDGPSPETLYAAGIVLQTKGTVENLESQARQTLASIDPNLTVVDYNTFEGQIAGQFNQDRLTAQLTLMFAVLALALASVGLYGVTSYTVARRSSEIGIRMALGADRGNVVGMVMREAMLQAGIGLAIGIPIALLCVRFVQAQLFGVEGHDVTVFASAVLALTVSALVAGFIPARRAASADPMNALRTE